MSALPTVSAAALEALVNDLVSPCYPLPAGARQSVETVNESESWVLWSSLFEEGAPLVLTLLVATSLRSANRQAWLLFSVDVVEPLHTR